MSSEQEHTQRGSRTRNYLLGLGSGYVFAAATIAVGLWLTPFTLRYLDREQFAIFALAGDVLMWLTLLDLGISSALRLQAAQLSGQPDQSRLNHLVSSAFFANLALMTTVLVVGAGLAIGFPHFFPIRPDLQREATILALLLLGGTVMSLATQSFSALLFAYQQIHVDNAINLLNLVTRTIATVVLLKAGWGLYSLGVANLVAKFTSSGLAIIRTYRLLPGLSIRWRYVFWDVLKGTGGIGIWFTVGGLAGILIMSLDRLITGKLISVELVTTLSLTGRLYALAATMLDLITNTARPMLAQLIGQQKWKEAATVYHQLFSLSTGLAIVAAASIWAGNGMFVSRWVGAHNYGGWLLDLALALRLIANSWVLPNRATLAAGLFKVPQNSLSRLAEALVSIPLALWLGSQFGLVGIVAGGVLAALLVTFWILPWMTSQMFQIKISELIRTDFCPLLFEALLLAIVATGARHIGMQLGGGWLGAAVACSLCGALGAVSLWAVGFSGALRTRLASQLATLLVRIRQRAPAAG